MDTDQRVIEYKCPCCGAALAFSSDLQKLACASCNNTFDIDAVQAYNESLNQESTTNVEWEESTTSQWTDEEQHTMQIFICPSCGGEILSDAHTVATFCPYCENPAIIPGRLSKGLKPDALIPFQTTRDDARNAFLSFCKGKPLLPKGFTEETRIEKITGLYVPFWLYDCTCQTRSQYRATRVHHWSDSRFHYTRTDHFLLIRNADAAFSRIPMDGSSKIQDEIMESIEPFDYSQMTNFNTAYLSGFFADKYDKDSKSGEERIRQRVNITMDEEIAKTCVGYATVVPGVRQNHIQHGKAKYVLLPVWMLHTRYRDKTYIFAMNGQTQKMTGTLPCCPKRSAAWFAGLFAGLTVLATLMQYLL